MRRETLVPVLGSGDSGVDIIRNLAGVILWIAVTAPAVTGQISVNPTPLMSVGLEPGTELVLVSDAAFVPDLGLFVLDRGARSLVRVDAHGGAVLRIGRAGRGPGELSAAFGVHVEPDSIFVFDSDNRRVSTFSFDGELLGDLPMRTPFVVGEMHRFEDGTWALRRQSRVQVRGVGSARDTVDYILVDQQLEDPRPLARVAGTLGVRYLSRGTSRAGTARFSPAASAAAFGSCLYVTSTDRPSILVVDTNGSIADTISYEPHATDRVVSRALREAYVDYWGDRPPPGVPPSSAEERARAALPEGFAETLPLTAGILVDPGGWVWLPDFEPFYLLSEAATVLTPSMTSQQRVALPRGLRLLQVGADFLVGLAHGPFGEEVIEVYALEGKGTSASAAPRECRAG